MNEQFVCIKVDREERPDVDAIYMEAVQAMTGQGGWPLTAFLDTDTTPFYCGTYFPPEPRHGMPSFRMVMEAVVASWETQRETSLSRRIRVRERLAAAALIEPADGGVSPALLEKRCGAPRSSRRPGERWLRRRAQVPASIGDRVSPRPR